MLAAPAAASVDATTVHVHDHARLALAESLPELFDRALLALAVSLPELLTGPVSHLPYRFPSFDRASLALAETLPEILHFDRVRLPPSAAKKLAQTVADGAFHRLAL